MTHISLPYRIAALAMYVAAALHITASALSGFSGDGLVLVPVGLVELCLGLALVRGMRWSAWLTFLLMIPAITFAVMGYYGGSDISGWIWQLLLLADVAAFLACFAVLWQTQEEELV